MKILNTNLYPKQTSQPFGAQAQPNHPFHHPRQILRFFHSLQIQLQLRLLTAQRPYPHINRVSLLLLILHPIFQVMFQICVTTTVNIDNVNEPVPFLPKLPLFLLRSRRRERQVMYQRILQFMKLRFVRIALIGLFLTVWKTAIALTSSHTPIIMRGPIFALLVCMKLLGNTQ